jgi:uncharacterized protein YqcC (DUF446 family)
VPTYDEVGAATDAIEAEMRRMGWWSEAPPPPEAFEFRQAFAMDTMAYSQWLQWIFLPRVRSIIAERGDFPSNSMVGTQAVREFDGTWEANELVSLLSKFDGLFS